MSRRNRNNPVQRRNTNIERNRLSRLNNTAANSTYAAPAQSSAERLAQVAQVDPALSAIAARYVGTLPTMNPEDIARQQRIQRIMWWGGNRVGTVGNPYLPSIVIDEDVMRGYAEPVNHDIAKFKCGLCRSTDLITSINNYRNLDAVLILVICCGCDRVLIRRSVNLVGATARIEQAYTNSIIAYMEQQLNVDVARCLCDGTLLGKGTAAFDADPKEEPAEPPNPVSRFDVDEI